MRRQTTKLTTILPDNPPPEPIFELPTIRLTADETRTLLRFSRTDKPIVMGYTPTSVTALIEMGLITKVSSPKPDETAIKEQWERIEKATGHRSISRIKVALEKIGELSKCEDQKSYALTPLGVQVARGITVRINSQFSR